MNYYNEFDNHAAAWLRNLISVGAIPPGDVDERSIEDVRPDDLRGYTQCHFFAGIGGWAYALDLAGWPRDRPVWTGSCPCQPFSAAGKGDGFADERDLWPAWQHLIAQHQPPVIFGEQVAAAIGHGWLDRAFSDLEGLGYACGAAVLQASGADAPHKRDRLWFVADSEWGSQREEPRGWSSGRVGRQRQSVPRDTPWPDALARLRALDDGLPRCVAGTDAARNAIVPEVAAQLIAAHMEIAQPGGEAGSLPGSSGGFTTAVFKASDVPVGTKLYTTPPSTPVGVEGAVDVDIPEPEGLEKVVRDAVAAWEECRSPMEAQAAMYKISNDLRTNEAARALAQQPAAVDDACAIAAIQFALNDPEGMTFLRLWNEGEFETTRREWPEAPSSIYIGADPSLTAHPPDPTEKDAEIEALRAEVAEWKRVASAQAELHGEAEARAEAGSWSEVCDAFTALSERVPAHQPAAVGAAEAWQEGYRQGVLDERASEGNIGIAGFGAKVEPARNNPYAIAQQPGGPDNDH